MTASIIYYTDSQLDEKIAVAVRDQLQKISQERNLPIISSSLESLDFGENHHVKMKRGYEAMFTQILTCLENAKTDLVYFCEADVLYHPSHFDFTPERMDTWYYDINWWKVHEDGTVLHWDAEQLSGLCCSRQLALDYYREKVCWFDPDAFDRKFEPFSGEGSVSWKAEFPSIDIRHNRNLTYSKKAISDFRNKATATNFQQIDIKDIPGWNLTLKDIYG